MRILQLITGLAMGGAEKVVVDLCTKSKESSEHQFYVVSLTENMDRKPDLDKLNIPVISLGIKKNIKSVYAAIKRLKRFIHQNNIDVIHAHMTHAYLITILANLPNTTPIVFTGHNTNLGSKWREVFLWATKSLRKIDIIFDENQLRYFHKSKDCTKIIPNGIPIEDIINQQKGIKKNKTFTFINIGNLELQKNQIALVESARVMRDKNYLFKILIVGEGSKYEFIHQLILSYDLQNIVILLGKRKDVPILLAKSHCFVLPSNWEGMPITILEAGVTGIPIIATPVGNIPTVLAENRGIITQLENITEKMEYTLNHYHELLSKSEKLFQYIQSHFSLEYIYKNHLELYKQIMKK